VAPDQAAPEQEETAEGYNVFWEHPHFPPDDVEAELPDGTRVRAVWSLGGRRVGFDRRLPKGTQLYLRGKPTWKRVGESD
jgi:hypothetical protein